MLWVFADFFRVIMDKSSEDTRSRVSSLFCVNDKKICANNSHLGEKYGIIPLVLGNPRRSIDE